MLNTPLAPFQTEKLSICKYWLPLDHYWLWLHLWPVAALEVTLVVALEVAVLVDLEVAGVVALVVVMGLWWVDC